MKLFKKIAIYIVGIIVCWATVLSVWTGTFHFGEFYSRFVPCVQHEQTIEEMVGPKMASCDSQYDMQFTYYLMLAIVILVIIIFIKTFNYIRKNY